MALGITNIGIVTRVQVVLCFVRGLLTVLLEGLVETSLIDAAIFISSSATCVSSTVHAAPYDGM